MTARTLLATLRSLAPWRDRPTPVADRLPAHLSAKAFCEDLVLRGLRHVVLPWSCPERDGATVEILACDDDAGAILGLLEPQRRALQAECRVYSVHFLPKFGWNQSSLLPPYLAEAVIARGVVQDGVRLPCREDAFHCLAFHVLYHLGLGDDDISRTDGPQSDLVSDLRRRAVETGLDRILDRSTLDAHLGAMDWRPSLDRLEYWGQWVPYCRELARGNGSMVDAPCGLAVFLIRELGSDETTVAGVEQTLKAHGFEVLLRRALTPAARNRVSRYVRGGDWGPGPFPLGGGGPAILLAVRDPAPALPSQSTDAGSDAVDNQRITEVKLALRDGWNQGRAKEQHANIVHGSDNAHHAARYLELAGEESVLRALAREARPELTSPG